MAFRIGDSDDSSPIGDINVTPLVDVMLVLLIIFMITAPMLHQGIEVALPQVQAEALPQRDQDPLVLSIKADGLVYVADEPLHPSLLQERLQPLLEARGADQVFIKADKDTPYGAVAAVIDVVHRAGPSRLGLVTDPTGDRRR